MLDEEISTFYIMGNEIDKLGLTAKYGGKLQTS
jgi:hypothetical protein